MQDMMEKARQMAQEGLPKCDVCGGHLMGGAGTFNIDGTPLVVCSRCVTTAVEYWVKARNKRLNAKGD